MASQDVSTRIEHLAEMVVLSDLSDPRVLAEMHTEFGVFLSWASEKGDADLVKAATSSMDFVEKIILEEAGDLPTALTAVTQTIEGWQRILRDGCSFAEVNWPGQLGLGGTSAGEEPVPVLTKMEGGLYHPGIPPAHIDASIYADFLLRQGSVLEEIEGLILKLERDGDGEALAALRRMIHTIKGESAMLGLVDVERLCHSAEDAIGQRPILELTDSLLSLKDWLGRAFECYQGRAPIPEPVERIMALWLEPETPVLVTTTPEAPETPEASTSTSHMLEGDPGLLGEFVAEAVEHLESSDLHLLTLETDPSNQDAINAVFRAFHTIKGVAGFLALPEIQSLAHEAENLLDKARKNEIELVGRAIDVSFDAVDMLKQLVSNVSTALSSGAEFDIVPGMAKLITDIKNVASGKTPLMQESFELPASAPGMRVGDILVSSGSASEDVIERGIEAQDSQTAPKIGAILSQTGKVSPTVIRTAAAVRASDPSAGKIGEILVEMGAVTEADIAEAISEQQEPSAGKRLGQLLVEGGEVAPKDVAQALRSQKMQQQGVQMREAVKVDADRLDLLVDTIGELVIAESMVSQSPELQGSMSTELARHLSQLDKITRELQEMGTSLRMVPVRSTFQKMARLVRDLAKKSGKLVEFVSQGEETELDKTVVDKIGDPLVHMVRNAVDHGLEATREDRIKAGKSETGRVELRAFHKGGSIYVEILDDGRGLDKDAILAKARERGLLREGEVISERETWNLVFEPGFSTAKKVTDVSGRGVGMDVVKRNIEALRGQVEIQSEYGKGTTFSIRLPLTLAIIDGMVVRVGEERYILPTLSIVMSIRPDPKQLSSVVQRGEMLEIQGRLLPLFRLGRMFNVPNSVDEITDGIVIVIEDEGKQTGLLVDEILGQQQIVIKSLGEALRGTPGLAGGAIMPDGTVGLILDVSGLVRLTVETQR